MSTLLLNLLQNTPTGLLTQTGLLPGQQLTGEGLEGDTSSTTTGFTDVLSLLFSGDQAVDMQALSELGFPLNTPIEGGLESLLALQQASPEGIGSTIPLLNANPATGLQESDAALQLLQQLQLAFDAEQRGESPDTNALMGALQAYLGDAVALNSEESPEIITNALLDAIRNTSFSPADIAQAGNPATQNAASETSRPLTLQEQLLARIQAALHAARQQQAASHSTSADTASQASKTSETGVLPLVDEGFIKNLQETIAKPAHQVSASAAPLPTPVRKIQTPSAISKQPVGDPAQGSLNPESASLGKSASTANDNLLTNSQSTTPGQNPATNAPAEFAATISRISDSGQSPLNIGLQPVRDVADQINQKLDQTSFGTRPQQGNAPSEQVTIHLQKALQDGANRIQIQLQPTELGRVEVQIDINSSGKASLMILAEKPETLELLQRDGRVLERSMQDSGLKLEHGGMQFNLKGSQQQASDEKNGTNPNLPGQEAEAGDDESQHNQQQIQRYQVMADNNLDIVI